MPNETPAADAAPTDDAPKVTDTVEFEVVALALGAMRSVADSIALAVSQHIERLDQVPDLVIVAPREIAAHLNDWRVIEARINALEEAIRAQLPDDRGFVEIRRGIEDTVTGPVGSITSAFESVTKLAQTAADLFALFKPKTTISHRRVEVSEDALHAILVGRLINHGLKVVLWNAAGPLGLPHTQEGTLVGRLGTLIALNAELAATVPEAATRPNLTAAANDGQPAQPAKPQSLAQVLAAAVTRLVEDLSSAQDKGPSPSQLQSASIIDKLIESTSQTYLLTAAIVAAGGATREDKFAFKPDKMMHDGGCAVSFVLTNPKTPHVLNADVFYHSLRADAEVSRSGGTLSYLVEGTAEWS